jgi:hypothetical protein
VENCNAELAGEAESCIHEIATICAHLTDLGSNTPAHHSQSSESSRDGLPPNLDSAAMALTFSRSRIEYLIDRISDSSLEDVQPGAPITADRLCLIHDTQVSSVRCIVKECPDRTALYAALPGADSD